MVLMRGYLEQGLLEVEDGRVVGRVGSFFCSEDFEVAKEDL